MFMTPWLFSIYIDAVMKEVKMSMERSGVRLLEGGGENKDYLVSCMQIT